MSDFAKRIEQYRKLDAKIDEISERHKAELAPLKELKEKLNNLILNMLNNAGQDSAATEAGTAYKKSRITASLEDPDAFRRHVIGTESWELADWKANPTAVTDFVEANQCLPPGVKITTKIDVGIRAPAKKAASKASRIEAALQAAE